MFILVREIGDYESQTFVEAVSEDRSKLEALQSEIEKEDEEYRKLKDEASVVYSNFLVNHPKPEMRVVRRDSLAENTLRRKKTYSEAHFYWLNKEWRPCLELFLREKAIEESQIHELLSRSWEGSLPTRKESRFSIEEVPCLY